MNTLEWEEKSSSIVTASMDTNIYHQMMSLSEMGSNLIGPIDFDDQMLDEINQKLLNSEKDSNVEEGNYSLD